MIAKVLAAQLGISPTTLRKWAEGWEALDCPRDAKGKSFFSEADVEKIQMLHEAIKGQKLKIEEARQVVQRHYEKLNILQELKAMRAKLQAYLD